MDGYIALSAGVIVKVLHWEAGYLLIRLFVLCMDVQLTPLHLPFCTAGLSSMSI